MTARALTGNETLPGLRFLHQGKVRRSFEILATGYRLVEATNRLSIFDFVLPAEVEDKGAILTALNIFWRLGPLKDACPHDLLAFGPAMDPHLPWQMRSPEVQKRYVIVRPLAMVPYECIARGFLTGSGLEAYRKTGEVCGHVLPTGLTQAAELSPPIFTPSTKATIGHDEHVDVHTFRTLCYGPTLEETTLHLYAILATYLRERGLIIADCKGEFGYYNRVIHLGDEFGTLDAIRLWKAGEWSAARAEGRAPRSYDKQLARDWGKQLGIDTRDPANPDDVAWVRSIDVPQSLLDELSALYHEAFQMITGMTLAQFQREVMRIAV